MIFGRNKKQRTDGDEHTPEVDERDQALDEDSDEGEPGDESAEEGTEEYFTELDLADWRDDGPFDISEVDLEADDIDRLDFGCLILTPFEGLQLQLQVDQESGVVHAALVMHEQSALEVALFAAPANAKIVGDARHDMVDNAEAQGGNAVVTKGPFGSEIRRVIPLKGPQGEDLVHVSRTWLVHGPRWMLRGVLMGEAGMSDSLDGPAELLHEFFCNLVVQRDSTPRVPGDLIPMTIPEQLQEQS